MSVLVHGYEWGERHAATDRMCRSSCCGDRKKLGDIWKGSYSSRQSVVPGHFVQAQRWLQNRDPETDIVDLAVRTIRVDEPRPSSGVRVETNACATLFAAAGNTTESASEALLVSTILDLHGPRDAFDSLTHDLPAGRVANASPDALAAARRRAHDLALELLGHFISEGQFASADLYEALAVNLHRP